MNNIFLSIVIPVYNAASTISRCLDSIWCQGLDEAEYEVICVNDCSTDNTIQVISEIRKTHNNLRLFSNTENIRAGGSRNRGVREAYGEYILFIDADDYFHPGALKVVCDYQKKYGLDILMCDFARHTIMNENDILVHNFKSQEVMTGRKFLIVNSLPFAPWKYVFKRSLMTDNNVFFTERVSCEDVDWSHKIAFFAVTMQYQPILLTHYILNDSSQTSVEYRNPNTVFHRLQAGKRVTDLLQLYESEAERKQIQAVAKATLKNGLIFLNCLIISPRKKRDAIKDNVSCDIQWGRVMNFIRDYPLLYSWFSTIISPFFRLAVYTKRNLFGR